MPINSKFNELSFRNDYRIKIGRVVHRDRKYSPPSGSTANDYIELTIYPCNAFVNQIKNKKIRNY